MRWGRSVSDSYAATRRRMIRETELALLVGITSNKHPRIPTIEVGKGSFPQSVSESFWEQLLEVSDVERERLMALFTEKTDEQPVIELS